MRNCQQTDNFDPVIHLFTETAGLNVDTDDFNIKNYFTLFINIDLFNCMVHEANTYTEQFIQSHPDKLQKRR